MPEIGVGQFGFQPGSVVQRQCDNQLLFQQADTTAITDVNAVTQTGRMRFIQVTQLFVQQVIPVVELETFKGDCFSSGGLTSPPCRFNGIAIG